MRSAREGLREITESLGQPFNLAVAGRMKAGKSSLINGLLGKKLAISDVEEATATLNWICHGEGDKLPLFLVHWKDGRVEPLPLSRLVEWSGKTPEVLKRVKETSFLRMYSDTEYLREVQIIDTPGTGSAVEEHSEVADEFLNPDAINESIHASRKADAILYVIPTVGRDNDEAVLQLFRSGSIPGSDPYNSVCVLHKWDALEVPNPREEAQRKAAKLKQQLGGYVAEVIPVSGPLALAARNRELMPDEAFYDLLEIISNPSFVPERALSMPERWDHDSSRAQLRHICSCLPWASFRLLVRLLIREKPGNVLEARNVCLGESGIEQLESLLAERIFSQAAVIKAFQALKRVEAQIEPALRLLMKMTQIADRDRRQFSEMLNTDRHLAPDQIAWASQKCDTAESETLQLKDAAITLDREWQQHKAELESLERDLSIHKQISDNRELILPEHRSLLLCACDPQLTLDVKSKLVSKHVTAQKLEVIITYYRSKINTSSRKERVLFEHLVDRLEEVHAVFVRE